jgi:branched-chain amino acid transport system permease protein
MEALLSSLLNGLSYGLLLFMLSAGLTLIFSLMGVMNFAHASFYMLGAYLGATFSQAVGLIGAVFEHQVLRRVHARGHVAELLVTFGFSGWVLEVVQLVWGRSALGTRLPQALQGPLFSLNGVQFPSYKLFMMAVALVVLALMGLLIYRTRVGLLIQAALTHPGTLQTLGHDVPHLFMGVFAGGAALAGLAGVMGSVIFVVVVVGGLGSLSGALWAALLIGCLQTAAVGFDVRLYSLWPGRADAAAAWAAPVLQLKLSQMAPVLPYVLLVLFLVLRPKGLRGQRES